MTGTGTVGDPFIISDVDDLQAVNDDLTAYYELGGDINASATSGWNAGAGFAPIGTFTGSFDGKGYSITGLFINRASTDDIGLFGSTSGSTIQNTTLVDVDITGDRGVGGLIGSVYGAPSPCQVTNCQSSGSVTGRYVGGLIGIAYASTITQCLSSCVVNGTQDYAGGFVGRYDGEATGTITGSYATGNVEVSRLYAGGFAGYISSGTVSTCYSTGNVQGDSIVGGFVGRVETAATILDSYARGSSTALAVIYASGNASGFADYVRSGNTIQNCYATGHITRAGVVPSGFCSDNEGSTITACFWDTQTSGQATSDGGTGKTTAEMKLIATFSGWDIEASNTDLNNGYPFLSWQLPGSSPVWYIYEAEELIMPIHTDVYIVALEALRNIEMSAMGRVYVDESGNLCYENRYARQL